MGAIGGFPAPNRSHPQNADPLSKNKLFQLTNMAINLRIMWKYYMTNQLY